jgi:hypothetical protein
MDDEKVMNHWVETKQIRNEIEKQKRFFLCPNNYSQEIMNEWMKRKIMDMKKDLKC